MEHFVFPGNIDFTAVDQGAPSRCIHLGLMCLFIVCETIFTIGKSRAISYANNTEQQAQQLAWNSRRRRLPKLWRTLTKIRETPRNREAERTSLSTAKATPLTQRPQACTEAAKKYYNYTANETDEEREHRLPTLQKVFRRSGNALS